MRNQSRIIKEEGFVLVLPDELEGLVVDAVGSVFLALEHVVAPGVVRIGSLGEGGVARNRWFVIQRNALFITPQVIRVVTMSMALAIVTEESIKALFQRIAFRTGTTQPPFPESPRSIALAFEHFGHRELALRDRPLAFGFHFSVVAYESMPRMLARHKDATRGSAHRIARVVAGEPHALESQLIEAGRLDLFLSVAPELGITQVVGQDQNDARLAGKGGAGKNEKGKQQAENQFHPKIP